VKEKLGDKLLLYRLGADDLDPAGTTIEEAQIFAKKLESAGIDILDVSGGLGGSRPAQVQGTQGYFIPQAQKIKKVVSIPVIGVGGITEPKYANQIIQNGQVDLVAVGREFLKNPDWAQNAIAVLKK
jgi:2,4-dienoyl-CoA reductase-like NADH-dependent reductase (Old Yellow Enzyme family)